MNRKRIVVPAILAALAGTPALADHCTPVFDLTLGTPGPVASFSNIVTMFYASDVVTPGSKPLYVGGSFDTIGGVAGTVAIARWDGAAFSPLASGVHRIDIDTVSGLPVYSTGSVSAAIAFGGALYIGGQFDGTDTAVNSRGAIRWNGTAFESINPKDPDIGNYVVNAFAVYQGQLYAGGNFSNMGSVTTNSIARYDASANDWSAVDGGSNNAIANVFDLVVFNDGSGEKLYASGNFTAMGTAASPSTKHIARFDGTSWQPVGPGYITSGANNYPRDLVVFDDGTGPALYAGGGVAVADLANPVFASVHKWDGQKWTGIPGFLDDPNVVNATISAMGVYNDGTGTTLYAQARLSGAGGANPRQALLRLESGRFEEVAGVTFGTGSIFEMYQHNDGSGSKLFVGGSFTTVGTTAANRIATITGCTPTGGVDPCPADFNDSGAVTVQDIFDFLAAYFTGCP